MEENLLNNMLYHDIIECLAAALDAKDSYTCGHSLRVSDMSYDLAREIGIEGAKLESIHIAGHLHDIGKIGVPDYVLNKSTKLSEEEWRQIKKHPEYGYNILSKSSSLKEIAQIVLYHHERWDGKGYPEGLSGADIPIGARIIAVCDTIDAMTSARPYREPFSWEECRLEVERNTGLQFDSELVKAASCLWGKWESNSKQQSYVK